MTWRTNAPMSHLDEVLVLPEPLLEFRHAQALEDPHDGLSIFGPYDADLPSHPRNISYGLVGTSSGIDMFGRWAEHLRLPAYPPDGGDRRLWPTFPGFEAAFASVWPEQPTWTIAIDEQQLRDAARDKDPNKRASWVVERYLDGIQRLSKRDDPIGVIVCVVPDVVYINCRPGSRVAGHVPGLL